MFFLFGVTQILSKLSEMEGICFNSSPSITALPEENPTNRFNASESRVN